jgi:superkiller protein 3
MRLRIRLETGWGWNALGRFRLSVTHDPIHLPDPKRAALRLLRRIHQRHPDNYWVNLALTETLSEQTPPALDEAIRYATAALALRPNEATPRAALVRVWPTSELAPDHPLGELAVFHARRLRDLEPNNAFLRHAANRQTALAASLIKQRKLDEAITKCNMAIGLQPDHVGAHFWLGLALATQGNLDEAIDAYRRTLVYDPNHYTAQANISHLLVSQGRLDKAIVAAQKAQKINPDCAEGHRALSAALAAEGRLNEATDAYRRCLDSVRHRGRMGQVDYIVFWHLESRPTDPFAHFEYGIVMLEQGKLEEAIDGFRKVHELDPEHAMALLYLGNALRQQGSLDEAIQAYRKAVGIDPQYTYAHRNLGIALMAQGNFRAARRALQKSLDISGGGDGRDWFFVAMSEWRLGNEGEARRWYDRAVRWMDENEPENEQLVKARAEAEKTLGLKQNDVEQED